VQKALRKRVLVLTGAPGVGKTSVIIKTVDALKAKGFSVGGMISREVREGNVRVGFEILNLTNSKHGWLAHGLRDGEHTLLVHGLTDMGHTFSSNVTFIVDTSTPILDNSTPRISIVSPKNETYLGFGYGLPLNFLVSKPIVWAIYSLNNGANVTIFGNITRLSYNTGPNNITVYAVDAAGNVGASETIHFTMVDFHYSPQYNAFLPSPISPVISVFFPQNVAYNASNVPVTFTIDKPISLDESVLNSSLNGFPNVSWVGYSLDGQNNITLHGNTTLTGLPKGAHNITVYANDTYGNIGASQTIFFATKAEPFPTAVAVIVSGASLAAIGLTLLVYFKKRKHSTAKNWKDGNTNLPLLGFTLKQP
jgi:hypothetical protein